MIIYHDGAFGIQVLTRFHGSAVYRGIIPALSSTMVLITVVSLMDLDIGDPNKEKMSRHPYAAQALISFFTFLITFRANFAYNRYWEACTAVHQMLSKWLDVGLNLAAYHYQSEPFASMRPPTFGENPSLRNMTKEREHQQANLSQEEYESKLDASVTEVRGLQGLTGFLQEQRKTESGQTESETEAQGGTAKVTYKAKTMGGGVRSLVKHVPSTDSDEGGAHSTSKRDAKRKKLTESNNAKAIMVKDKKELRAFIPLPKFDNSRNEAGSVVDDHPDYTTTDKRKLLLKIKSAARLGGGIHLSEPTLFLQETAHLLSLLSAVAMSTLRMDVEGTECPLVVYQPGLQWPPYDPDALSTEVRKEYHQAIWIERAFFSLLGFDRSDKHRTMYNAARPFRVLGGVSDDEMTQLQAARGNYAKVSLCTMWLQEFISREYQQGSTGKVAPPIISRIYQFVSDGMVGYNQARKISSIPFPFPHAQLTIVFIGVVMLLFPYVYFSFVNNLVLACCMNFATVLCFVGLHEVALEMERPFISVPNDIPLTSFQAQYNEALIVMYAGFHPDSWWEVDTSSARSVPATE